MSLTKELDQILNVETQLSSPQHRHAPQSVTAMYHKVSAYPYGVWSSRNPYTVNDFFQQDFLQHRNDTCTIISEELSLRLLVRDFWEAFFDMLPLSDSSQPLMSVCKVSTADGKHTEINVGQHHNSYISGQDRLSEDLRLAETSWPSDQEKPESQHQVKDRRSHTSEFDDSTLCGSDRNITKRCCPVHWIITVQKNTRTAFSPKSHLNGTRPSHTTTHVE